MNSTSAADMASYNLLSAIGRMAHAEQGIQSYPVRDSLPPAPTSPLERSTAVQSTDLQEHETAIGSMLYTPPSRLTTIPPPPPLQRVNAFSSHTAPLRNPFQDAATDEDDLMERLRTFRSELQLQQDGLYRGAETQADIKALDAKYEKLSDKIHSIEDVLSTFGAIFRTR